MHDQDQTAAHSIFVWLESQSHTHRGRRAVPPSLAMATSAGPWHAGRTCPGKYVHRTWGCARTQRRRGFLLDFLTCVDLPRRAICWSEAIWTGYTLFVHLPILTWWSLTYGLSPHVTRTHEYCMAIFTSRQRRMSVLARGLIVKPQSSSGAPSQRRTPSFQTARPS